MKKEDFITFEYGEGEMLAYERYKLYSWTRDLIRPQAVLEVGAGSGASSYYILKALEAIGNKGVLYTCDPEVRPTMQTLCQNFSSCQLMQSSSQFLISQLIGQSLKLDYLFFDGPEDPHLALSDLQTLESHIESGCYFSMHDWETVPRIYDGATSIKSELIRPYIENSDKWEKVEVLSGLTINSDYHIQEGADSVGLCLYKFVP